MNKLLTSKITIQGTIEIGGFGEVWGVLEEWDRVEFIK